MVRVRRGRVLAALTSLLVTLVAVLGAAGWLPHDGPAAAATGEGGERASLSAVTTPGTPETPAYSPDPTPEATPDETRLPADTGWGKRIVFDISDQRVWLVGKHDEVGHTYLVSGSLTDNLEPGTYAVFSRSRWAVGIEDSGTMEYFVRFTRGDNAAIGFHSIPSKDGQLLQTQGQLGTPQSHGCIRQARPDAKRLWAFAPVGTKVVVTA